MFNLKKNNSADSVIAPDTGFGLFKTAKTAKPAVVKRDFTRQGVAESDIQDAIEVVPVSAAPTQSAPRPSVFSGLKVTPRKPADVVQDDPNTLTMEADSVPAESVKDGPSVPEAPAQPGPKKPSAKPFADLFKKDAAAKPKAAPFAKAATAKTKPAPGASASTVGILLVGAAVLTAMGAAFSGVYAYQAYTTQQGLALEAAAAKATHLHTVVELDTKLLAASKSFSAAQSIAFSRATSRAERLWVPGTRVTLDAVPGKDVYSVVALPEPTELPAAAKPSNVVVTPKVDATLLNNIELPKGCTIASPAIPGDTNAPKITINCENNTGPFSAYLPR